LKQRSLKVARGERQCSAAIRCSAALPLFDKCGIVQNVIAIMFDLDREFVGQAAPDDPGIEIAWAPVVSRDRVWPIAVSPVHLREIGAAQ
jgi:hypothetical protein